MANLKLALRTLFKTPFVTAVAVLSLALGIGANAAIFSLFNQMLLRPLPVPQPNRLVNLEGSEPNGGGPPRHPGRGRPGTLSYPPLPPLGKGPNPFSGHPPP